VTTHTAKARMFSRRMLAVAAVAAITLSLALSMRVALANELFENQIKDGPISWDDPAFQGDAGDCEGADLEPGEVLWHFVHIGTDGSDLPATIDAEFDSAGHVPADGYSNGGGNAAVMYNVITGEDSLIGAEDTIVDDGKLVLSHICSGGEEEQSVAESASEEESVGESAQESTEASGEQSEKAGEGTPAESAPDGALSLNGTGPLATIAFSLILLASLGTLAYANVKAARN
jgi:hypothetical protein